MANPVDQLFAVVAADGRTLWRLPRFWLLAALVVSAGLGTYFALAQFHATYSWYSSTTGFISPRFLIHVFGIAPLGVLLAGVVLLIFDTRHREVRCRIAGVIDSRPISDRVFIAGRYLALLAAASFVLLLTVATIQAFGSAASAFDWPIGEPIEKVSLVSFVFVDALPALAVWCALALLLTIALQSRALVLLTAIGFLAAQYWLLHNVPIQLLPAVALLPSFGTFASDILPEWPDPVVFAQRFFLVPLTVALLIAASAVLRRGDGRSSRLGEFMVASTLAVTGVAGLTLLSVRSTDDVTLRAHWRAAHQTVEPLPRADIEHVEGRVRIVPGENLELDIRVSLSTPSTDPPPAELLLSLNPGMQLRQVLVDGESAAYRHESGLLIVRPRRLLQPAGAFVLTIAAKGTPDPRFAYLDSSVDPLAKSWAESRLPFLGKAASLFDEAFVALMPGTRWMPMPGPNLVPHPTHGPHDFFTVDLEIEVPPGWRIAAPGVGQPTDTSNRLRFRPGTALTEVTIVTAPFERFAVQVGGVEFELLLHPAHLSNVQLLGDTEQAVLRRLTEFIEDADNFGIHLPYGGLSVVEVPAQLRVYGGGHRMRSAQYNPGVLLMREHGFPTARFDRILRSWDAPAPMRLGAATGYFERDRTGGNLLAAATDHLLPLVTGQRGDTADAATSLLAHLTSRTFQIQRANFSALAFVDSDLRGTGANPDTPATRLQALAAGVAARIVRDAAWDVDHPSLWERATSSTWTDLAGKVGEHDQHHALATMSLKAGAIGKALLDLHGRRAVGDLLGVLRSRYEGSSFTMDDILAAAIEIGTPLDPITEDWLRIGSAPGFVSSHAEIRVVPNGSGRSSNLITVHLRNEKPVRGIVRLEVGTDRGDGSVYLNRQWSEPVPVPGHSSVEVGMLSASPPLDLWLLSYYSLNRSDMRLPMSASDNEHVWGGEPPFVGVRQSTWHPPKETAITVDDLDSGFSVESSRRRGLVQRLTDSFVSDDHPIRLDHGIPVFRELAGEGTTDVTVPPSWSRQEFGAAWGRYRRTLARAPSGDGMERAIFAAQLPSTGRWTLEYHLPDLSRMPRVQSLSMSTRISGIWSGGPPGTFDLTLAANGKSIAVEFDARRAVAGWNRVGTFTLESGDVRLIISSRSSGETVIADAIRWRRLES